MGIFKIAVVMLSGILFCSARTNAQNTISVTSNHLQPGSPLPEACREQAAVLQHLLALYPHPAQWRWIIVCDDAGWQHFLRSGDRASQREDSFPSNEVTIYASTDISGHLTCLRGTTLLQPDNRHAHADHVIAHELAHIFLHTEDEGRAERQALQWIKDRDKARLDPLEGQ